MSAKQFQTAFLSVEARGLEEWSGLHSGGEHPAHVTLVVQSHLDTEEHYDESAYIILDIILDIYTCRQ